MGAVHPNSAERLNHFNQAFGFSVAGFVIKVFSP